MSPWNNGMIPHVLFSYLILSLRTPNIHTHTHTHTHTHISHKTEKANILANLTELQTWFSDFSVISLCKKLSLEQTNILPGISPQKWLLLMPHTWVPYKHQFLITSSMSNNLLPKILFWPSRTALKVRLWLFAMAEDQGTWAALMGE
jgi:hypothetical protein